MPSQSNDARGRDEVAVHGRDEVAADGRDEVAVHGREAAYALLVAMSLVWGVHWVVVKVALGSMGPFTFAFIRMASGLATAFVIVGLRGRLRIPDRRDLPVLLSVALGQVAAGAILMNLALQVMPAGRSAVLVYTMPLWVALIQVLAFRVRPTAGEWAGMLFGLAGLALLLNPTAVDWSLAGEIGGAALLLLSAIIWAATTIHIRRHPWRSSPEELLPWQFLVAFLPFLLLAPILEPGLPVNWSPSALLVVVYSGPFATAFAAWAAQAITRSLGAQSATTGFLAVPLVGLLAGALLLGESLGITDVVGFGLIVAGVVATTRRPMAGTASRGGRGH